VKGPWSTRQHQFIAAGLLVLFVIIVIHPFFDLRHFQLKSPVHLAQFSLPVSGHISYRMELRFHAHPSAISVPRLILAEVSSPLLC
jgi:hypothetical protein